MTVLTKVIQGKTIQYTRMGLGLAALGRPGYMTLGHSEDLPASRSREDMLLHAMTVLDAAWASGIRYFDAARSYGEAELFLHTWLRTRGIAPDQLTVCSKWGYTYTAQWKVDAVQHEVKDHSLATLRRQCAESSSMLSPWLRLYQIHSATLESGVLENTQVVDELARLRDGGMLIGLSLSGVHQAQVLEKALSIQRGGKPVFGSVQATWNVFERSAETMLHQAHRQGWLVIVKEGLANGRLTKRGLVSHSPLAMLCRETHHSIDSLALAFILVQPWADVVLSGVANQEHLKSNLLAESLSWDPLWSSRLGEMTEEPALYWKTRRELQWN